MPEQPVETWTTAEREYRIYQDKFYKRSLRHTEYQLDFQGKLYVPPLGFERLQNEVACLNFIRNKTDIPVPNILEAYDDNGSFVLVTERLTGVKMNELSPPEQEIVIEEVERHVQTLRNLQSDVTGGPSGLVCPPIRAAQYFPSETIWSKKVSPDRSFVMCHCDLSQSNIIVNPRTLKIEGIIDWEYGGFWPDFFESPFFRDPRPSGAQFRDVSENAILVDFLKEQAGSNWQESSSQ